MRMFFNLTLVAVATGLFVGCESAPPEPPAVTAEQEAEMEAEMEESMAAGAAMASDGGASSGGGATSDAGASADGSGENQ